LLDDVLGVVGDVMCAAVRDDDVKIREGHKTPKLACGLTYFQPAEIDQLQLTFFVFKNESGYIFSCI
jgi:hypothetical protein